MIVSPAASLKRTRKSWVLTFRGVMTSLQCMASKSMTAVLASYPSAPAWAMNPFAAIDSSRQKESWYHFFISRRLRSCMGRTNCISQLRWSASISLASLSSRVLYPGLFVISSIFLKYHSHRSADSVEVLRIGMHFLVLFAFVVKSGRIFEDPTNKVFKERLEFFMERCNVDLRSGQRRFQRGCHLSWLGGGLA